MLAMPLSLNAVGEVGQCFPHRKMVLCIAVVRAHSLRIGREELGNPRRQDIRTDAGFVPAVLWATNALVSFNALVWRILSSSLHRVSGSS